jgi:hypothetical protein
VCVGAALRIATVCIGSQLALACVQDSALPVEDAGVADSAVIAPVDEAQPDAASQLPELPATDGGSVLSGFLIDADGGWLRLIAASWYLEAGHEAHLCARMTAPRDAYLHEFSPLIPLGTHHTIVTVVPGGSTPDGMAPCSGGDISGYQIYGSGVGSENYALPKGIAMRVRAGEQMVMNLHLFNVRDKALSGTSGVLVRTMPSEQVEQVAEGVLAGPLSLTIPTGLVTQRGKCTFNQASTIFAVTPHMHQLGVHMKVVADTSPAGSVVLFDGDYSFDSQQKFPVDSLRMKAGDVVRVECTYQNDGAHTVHWGQSSLDEMCFVGLGRFPAAQSGSFLCAG